MTHRRFGAGVAIVVMLLAVPALAHHAVRAQFDLNKPVNLTGVLKKVDWISPHAYLFFDVKDETGKIRTWAFETVDPHRLREAGLNLASFFKIGETYTVSGYAAKDGSDSAFVKDFKFPDGKVVKAWFGDLNLR